MQLFTEIKYGINTLKCSFDLSDICRNIENLTHEFQKIDINHKLLHFSFVPRVDSICENIANFCSYIR